MLVCSRAPGKYFHCFPFFPLSGKMVFLFLSISGCEALGMLGRALPLLLVQEWLFPPQPIAAGLTLLRGSLGHFTSRKCFQIELVAHWEQTEPVKKWCCALPEEFSLDNCSRSLENNRSVKYRLSHCYSYCIHVMQGRNRTVSRDSGRKDISDWLWAAENLGRTAQRSELVWAKQRVNLLILLFLLIF